MFHMGDIIITMWEELKMNKTYSMSIRVSENELEKIKKAAELESYSSYSEFVRRTALKESDRVIKKNERENTLKED